MWGIDADPVAVAATMASPTSQHLLKGSGQGSGFAGPSLAVLGCPVNQRGYKKEGLYKC